MKKIILILFLFLFAANYIVIGQSRPINDAQVWENIYLEKNITKRLLVRVNEEGRITENATRPSFVYLDMGFNYKLNKRFHFSIAYVFTQKEQKTETWSTRHQAYISATYRKRFGDFMLDDRQMFQWQVQDFYSSPTGRYAQYYLRNKLSIKYEKEFRFQPYIAEEIYYYINQPYVYWQYDFNRIRYFLGMYYHPNLINEFEVYYLFENNFNQIKANSNKVAPNPQNNWIIGLGYAHSF